PVQLVVGLVDPGAGGRAGRGARVAGAQGDVDGAAVPEAVVVVARGRVDGVHEHGDRLVGLDVAGHVGRPVLERAAAVAGAGDCPAGGAAGLPVQLVVGLVDPGAGGRAGRGARVAGAQGDVDGAAVPEAVVVVARGRVDGVHEHGDRLVGLDVAGHVGRPVLE